MTLPASSVSAMGQLPLRAPVLVINGSEATLQVVAGRMGPEGGQLVWSHTEPAPGQAMALLAGLIQQGLDALGITPSQLQGLACVHGPGSFTGLRIALSTALGFSLGSGAQLAGLDYLPLVAANAVGSSSERAGCIAVLTHARRGLVYFQPFQFLGADQASTGRLPPPMSPLQVLSLEAAVQAISGLPGPVTCLGSGLHRALDFFSAALPHARLLPPESNNPTPATLLCAALSAAYGPELPQPCYIRPSDAEDNLAQLTAARGQDPGLAQAELSRLLGEQP